jgi:polysaccharide biosynthesis protein VpsQ
MRIITAVFAAFLLTVIVLADAGRLGFLAAVYSFPYGDKAGHFILFGILAFLINLTVLGSRRSMDLRLAAIIVTLFLVLAIGLEEWSQRFFSERTSSWLDLLFSYAGVALGAWAAWRINKNRV